jgi:hypothetical protein
MSTDTLVTSDELLALPRGRRKRYEFVLGELCEMPGETEHAAMDMA